MAINDFQRHITELGARLQEFRVVVGHLDELLSRHGHNGYNSLVDDDFTETLVSKAEYDAAMVSVSNLVETWLPAGHGTNIDGYLYEVP